MISPADGSQHCCVIVQLSKCEMHEKGKLDFSGILALSILNCTKCKCIIMNSIQSLNWMWRSMNGQNANAGCEPFIDSAVE